MSTEKDLMGFALVIHNDGMVIHNDGTRRMNNDGFQHNRRNTHTHIHTSATRKCIV